MNYICRKMLLLAVISAVLVCGSPLWAAMEITVKDGKVVKVPVLPDQAISSGAEEGSGDIALNNTIKIQSAKYGNVSFELGNKLGYKQYFCNAKDFLVKECDAQKRCRIIVGSQICGDPYPGKGKYLYVEYTCDGKMKRAKNTQTEVMKLSCP